MNIGHKVTLASIGLLAILGAAMLGLHELRMSRVSDAVDATLTKHSGPPAAAATPSGRDLIFPVMGVAREHLVDTWGAARSGGRAHQGIDIMAPANTPVLAVADGRIVKFFDSERGGVTIYQFDEQERLVFYYAHLAIRAPSLREGDTVEQGQVIGYVGATGNATTPHLHFEIQRLTDERKWYRATAMNPYPYLISGDAPA